MKRVLVQAIKLYQYTIGMVLPSACRFNPSCSHYAMDAIMTHGIVKGMLLTGWRIVRCNPWCHCGFDPVPLHDWKHAFRPLQDRKEARDER
jgi:putative membrane protein insertion efficiency factor